MVNFSVKRALRNLTFSLIVLLSLTISFIATAQDCDFWSGECNDAETADAATDVSLTPKQADTGCNFWSGECAEEIGTSSSNSSNDFWSTSHADEVDRRYQIEQTELREQRRYQEAENRRRDELRRLSQEREEMQRESERLQAEVYQAPSRPRNSQPNMGAWGGIAKAANIFANEAYKQIDQIEAETARRQAEMNRRFRDQERHRKADQIAQKNAEVERRIADLERQSREAEAKAAREKQEREQRLATERLAQSQQQTTKLETTPPPPAQITIRVAGSDSTPEEYHAMEEDKGCFRPAQGCITVIERKYDPENGKLLFRIRNDCTGTVGYRYSLPRKDGTRDEGSWDLAEGRDTTFHTFNANDLDWDPSFGFGWGTRNVSHSWVCKEEKGFHTMIRRAY